MSSNNHDGQITLSEEAVADAIADNKRGAAVMWMGAVLGGMAIAVLFLGFSWYTEMQTSKALSTENKELTAKMATLGQDLTKLQRDQAIATATQARDAKYIEDLKAENLGLRNGRRPPPAPVPPPIDPFATVPR